MFLIVVIAVLSLMYGYVGWRLIVPAAFSTPVNVALWSLLVVFLVLPFLSVFMRFRGVDSSVVDTFTAIGYFAFGFITLLFAFVLIKDIIWFGWWGVEKLIAQVGSHSNPGELVDPERRRAIVNGINIGIVGLTSGLTGYGFYQAVRDPSIVRVDVPLKNLPPALDGFTIAQITDVHVSSTIKRPFVERIVHLVNDLKPDMVALTGDLVDGSVHSLRPHVEPLNDLQSPHGRFFITGNHEYYSGVEQWIAETKRLGFDVLLNEHRVIEKDGASFVLAGVTDYSGGQHSEAHRTDPFKAYEGSPEGMPSVLLAHQPLSIYDASKAGFDYVISGHTHGGQYFPYHYLVALFQPFVKGLHRYQDTQIYVSKGTGYWGPQLRLGARSEITLHRLVPA